MNQSRVDELLDGMIAGTLSEAEQAELDALIAADPAVARRVALMVDLTREIGVCLRPSSQVLPILEQPGDHRAAHTLRPVRRRPTLRLRRHPGKLVSPRFVALITALAAIITVVVLVARPTPRERWLEGPAEIAHSGRITPGQTLPNGTPILATGQALLCYADGTRVRLAGGTEVILGAGPGKQLQVVNGLVQARVAKQPEGAPFRLTTAHAQLIVVGTVFTVTVHGPRTELAVSEGAVRLRSSTGDILVSGGERQVVGEPVVTETPATPRSDDRPQRLIQRSAVWSYRDDGVEPEAGWLQAGFDDRHWRRGPAPLGYDRSEERAVITTHIRSDDRSVITGWFRHEFTCEDPEQIKALIIKLQRDDGAVIYLNGLEVVRDNMPEGPITAQTFATETAGKEHEEHTFVWPIPPDALRTGRNCIAVHVHQYALKSTDLLFSLELSAEYHAIRGTMP